MPQDHVLEDRIGRLGKNPEFNATDDGGYWRFSLARTTKYGTAELQWKDEESEWISVTVSGNSKNATIVRDLRRGQVVGVSGIIKEVMVGGQTYQNMSGHRVYNFSEAARHGFVAELKTPTGGDVPDDL